MRKNQKISKLEERVILYTERSVSDEIKKRMEKLGIPTRKRSEFLTDLLKLGMKYQTEEALQGIEAMSILGRDPERTDVGIKKTIAAMRKRGIGDTITLAELTQVLYNTNATEKKTQKKRIHILRSYGFLEFSGASMFGTVYNVNWKSIPADVIEFLNDDLFQYEGETSQIKDAALSSYDVKETEQGERLAALREKKGQEREPSSSRSYEAAIEFLKNADYVYEKVEGSRKAQKISVHFDEDAPEESRQMIVEGMRREGFVLKEDYANIYRFVPEGIQ